MPGVSLEDVGGIGGGGVLRSYLEQLPVVPLSAYKPDPTDIGPSIISAVAELPARGGTIALPPGDFDLKTTVPVINRSNVAIQGAGSGFESFSAFLDSGTRIRWAGAQGGTMFSFGADTTATKYARGLALRDVTLDGNDVAGRCLLVTSAWWGDFARLHLRDARTATLDITTITANASIAEDTQGCMFRQISVRNALSFSRSNAWAIRLGSGEVGQGNVSLNDFQDIHCVGWDHTVVQFGDSDSNRVGSMWISPLNGGAAIEFAGSNTLGTGHARANVFGFLQAGGTILSRGSGLTQPAINNNIMCLSLENGVPTVTVEAGSTLYYKDDRGNERLQNGIMRLFGTGSPEGAKTAPVGSHYLRSDGGAGTSFYVKESGTGNTGWVAK